MIIDEELRKDLSKLREQTKRDLETCETLEQRVDTVLYYCENCGDIFDEINLEFQNRTGLHPSDYKYVFLATALQCIRQYVLNPLLPKFQKKDRLSDKEAADKVKGNSEEHSNRHHQLYNPSFEEIIANPVPFDAIEGSKKYDLGLSGKTHRMKTLGHDPILGLVFGTANIATSTLTTTKLQSYHIKTGANKRDMLYQQASTIKIFENMQSKILQEGMEGLMKVVASFIKEVQHLRSDLYSKEGLPLPLITLNPEWIAQLSRYGLDFTNAFTVGMQGLGAMFINMLISWIHYLFYNREKDGSLALYKLKTKKIISYSNSIASGSNILVTLFTHNAELLDIGGIAETLHKIVTSTALNRRLQQEFLVNRWNELIEEI